MGMMKVAKWGNSLAVRLPADLVRELGLKEGDLVDRDVLALRGPVANMTREEAIAAIKEARKSFPKGLKPEDWKIDRSDPDMRG
jgi:antitoxin MazE